MNLKTANAPLRSQRAAVINWSLLALAVGAFGIGTTEFGPMGFLPDIAAGIHVSIPKAGQIVSAYAIGVTISELRATGGNGGTSASTGRLSTAVGANDFIAHSPPPAMTITTARRPMAILADGLFMPRRPHMS